ncbi:MAG: hypothetical protein JNM28_07040 [Armatimonadetes bacterium]|nr:hypothetical protein [Armatimonadota bacterium]MBS1711763.1 hypothetical protein [Armatimonadota bacterium]MBX3109683.1 hypothetical protein [Fimbriimonadaceae bacterium]
MAPITISLAVALTWQTPDTDAKSMDFWIGSWVADSHQPDKDGKMQLAKDAAHNTVSKIKGGKVVHEDFHTGGFNGESWSVFDPKESKWHQTWVDDSGAYLTFEGGKVGSEVILTQTHPKKEQRMRFTKITAQSFVWIWEHKDAAGWKTDWQLDYRRTG